MYLGRRPDAGLTSGCYLSPPRCNSVAFGRSPIFDDYQSSVFALVLAMPRLRYVAIRRFASVACKSRPPLFSLAYRFHVLPVSFPRRMLRTGRSDSDGESALKNGRFTDTSTAGDISLLNYNGVIASN